MKSKACFSFKQYIKNKPTKWGFKLWCLCDSQTGYTVNFAVYRGKEGESLSSNGLSYDVVVRLATPFLKPGIQNIYGQLLYIPLTVERFVSTRLMLLEPWHQIAKDFLNK